MPRPRLPVLRFCLVVFVLPGLLPGGVFVPCGPLVRAEDAGAVAPLPFDRRRISRYSVDNLPRSLSLRQGTDVWLGYDLERGKLFKAWKATDDEPGLVVKGFTTRSQGTTWHEDTTDAGWRYSCQDRSAPLAIRYLGCSDRGDHVELRWELRNVDGGLAHRRFVLTETIPGAPGQQARAERWVQVDRLEPGEALVPPAVPATAWKLLDADGAETTHLTGSHRHRWVLP